MSCGSPALPARIVPKPVNSVYVFTRSTICRLLQLVNCIDKLSYSIWQVELSFFDATSSSTAKTVTCYDSVCTSKLPTSAAVCLEQNNRCGYSFHYGDGSGTSGYYVTDNLYFDMILDRPDLVANSSAQVTFGLALMSSRELAGYRVISTVRGPNDDTSSFYIPCRTWIKVKTGHFIG